jgi:beta-glucosidase
VLSGGGSSQVRSVGGAPVEIPLTEGAAMSFARVTWHASSPLKAIRATAPQAEVSYVAGTDPAAAAKAAADADVAIELATQWTNEAEDAEKLSLRHDKEMLFDADAKANPKTLVVLETGGPVLMPWLDQVPAVIEAWYPGQRGGEAIARILFGEVNPSGHLPITFPASVSQAPRPEPVGRDILADAADAAANAAIAPDKAPVSFPVNYVEGSDVGYRWYEKTGHTPAFPFGYGLSYTDFSYRNLHVTGGDRLVASVDVTNTGSQEGADVPQLYVGHGDTPMRLADFRRVMLAPGETQRVTFVAEPRILAEYDTSLPGWRIAGGPYRVAVGHDAADRALSATAMLTPRTMRP